MPRRPALRPSRNRRRSPSLLVAAVAAVVGVAMSGATALALAAPAAASSASVVISEVYGGGGNTGAPYTNDFVELYNGGSSPVDLTGWTVTYSTSTGTSPSSTALTGSVAPQHDYLVQEAAGATPSTPLPAPDATGTSAMSSASGQVVLTNASAAVVDRVGYGTATTFEGTAAAPGLSNTTSDARRSPCADTDQNGTDFTAGPPTPENSSTATPVCAQPPVVPQVATIDQIQGASQVSPLRGQAVTGVTGTVTALAANGYWFQSTHPDHNNATSEGLFAFTGKAPAVQVGDAVSAAGTVSEFTPTSSAATDLPVTELDSPTTTVLSSGNPLPAPVVIGVDRTPPAQTVESGSPGDLEAPGVVFNPSKNAIDFDESLEGMRVAVPNARVVGPTNSFGETAIVPGNAAHVLNTPHGGVLYSGYDRPNAARLIADDSLLPPDTGPAADVGDRFAGTTVGVMDYSFSEFHLMLTQAPALVKGNLQREVTRSPAAKQLAVATFNVENLAPTDPQLKFDRLAGQIIHNLAAPDLVALEEIQDNSGAVDDGTVASDVTVGKLIAAITAAGGPQYSARSVDPTNDTDGGQPGGNIRQVFIYRTDRGLGFVDSAPAGVDPTTTADSVVNIGGQPQLALSPGRIDPGNAAWTQSRKPLVGQFTWLGQPFFVIANHFDSKLGDQAIFGRFQPPSRSSEVQRHEQAQEVRSFVDSIQAVNRSARVVVLGDLNDFEFSQTADILVGQGPTALTDLPRTLPRNQRYTYVFDGNSQVLDHILISRSWASAQYDIVHTNSEFHDQDSDHDPQIVRLRTG